MTISSTTRKAGPTIGNAVATAFPFAFKVFQTSDITVTLATISSGAQSVLVLNTDYTVALNADQNANPGGSVTYSPAAGPMTSANSLTISSNVPNLQQTDLTNGGAFLADVIENMADNLEVQIQQIALKQGVSIQFPVVDAVANSNGALPAWQQRAGMLLSFDANGNPQTVAMAAQSATALSAALAATNGATLIGYNAQTLYQYLTALDTYLPIPTSVLSLNGAQLRGTGNYLVNGSAEVAQNTATVNLSTSAQYGQVDQCALWASGGAASAGTLTQNTTATVGRTGYAARVSAATLTGSGVISWRYRVESKDAIKLKNQNGSFQIAVRHNVGSNINYTIIVRKPTAADNYASTTTIATGSPASVPTTTAAVLTLPAIALGDVSNGIEIEVQAACGAIATKTFDFTEWQLEEGSTCSLFERRNYREELRACRRYLPSYIAGGSSEAVCPGMATSTTSAVVWYPFEVEPRIIPTGITTSGSFFALNSVGGTISATSLTYAGASTGKKAGGITVAVASGLVGGNASALYSTNGTLLFTGAQL